MEYPIHKKDSLERTVSTKWSDSKMTVKKYWGDTNGIKMIYTIYGDVENPREVDIDAFDKSRNIIASYSSARGLVMSAPGFMVGDKNNLKFNISDSKINDWKKIVKKYDNSFVI